MQVEALRDRADNLSVPLGHLSTLMATDLNASGLAVDLQLLGAFLDGVPEPADFVAAIDLVDAGADVAMLAWRAMVEHTRGSTALRPWSFGNLLCTADARSQMSPASTGLRSSWQTFSPPAARSALCRR